MLEDGFARRGQNKALAGVGPAAGARQLHILNNNQSCPEEMIKNCLSIGFGRMTITMMRDGRRNHWGGVPIGGVFRRAQRSGCTADSKKCISNDRVREGRSGYTGLESLSTNPREISRARGRG
jgi:hypothetical protein